MRRALQRIAGDPRISPTVALRRLAGRRDGAATRAPAPFIVGAPRSGTTLMRLMLDAHPELAIPPETYFIPKAVTRWNLAARIPRRGSPCDAFYEAVVTHPRWPDFHLDPAAFRRRLDADRPTEVGDAVRAFYRLYCDKVGASRWGDKTPFYVRRMTLIQAVVPEARFVHVIRDGRAVALSIKDLWFGPDTVEEAADFWTDRIRAARGQARRLRHYLEVRYEDVVTDPRRELGRICEFLELPWDERILDYHSRVQERLALEVPPEEVTPAGRRVSTAERRAIVERVARPPDPSRIDHWKSDMPPADRARFEAIAGPLLEQLGYERAAVGR